MTDVTQGELIALLLKVEGGRPDSLGISTQWHRNPEGPQAVQALATARAEIEALKTTLGQRNDELHCALARIAELEALAERVKVLEDRLGALISETDSLNYVCNQSDGPAIEAARAALAGETPCQS